MQCQSDLTSASLEGLLLKLLLNLVLFSSGFVVTL